MKRIRIKTNSGTFEGLLLESALEKMKGMMFLKTSLPMVFPLRHGRLRNLFHTFFVRFPLDFYFLDRKLEVVDIHRNVKPFRIVLPRKPVSYCLEARAGVLDLKIGEKIEFKV